MVATPTKEEGKKVMDPIEEVNILGSVKFIKTKHGKLGQDEFYQFPIYTSLSNNVNTLVSILFPLQTLFLIPMHLLTSGIIGLVIQARYPLCCTTTM